MPFTGTPQLVATTDVQDPQFDGVILVTNSVSHLTGKLASLKKPIEELQQVDNSCAKDVSFIRTDAVPSKRLIFSPTGLLNRDYDDVRRWAEAGKKGLERALKAGCKSPLLVRPVTDSFQQSDVVTSLGALYAAYVPIEIREDVPEKAVKIQKLGIWFSSNNGTAEKLKVIQALEEGRIVARDIGGSDPERMAAPRVAHYIQEIFGSADSSVTVSITSELATLEKNYPLLAAVNRAAKEVTRHQARLIFLEYIGGSEINTTLFLVGKGITYDTGGLDIKAGGVMAGMHRDKCGAAAVAGFFKVLSILKPKGIKVVGTMSMVRNSVGPDGYVSDEIITSRANVRVRVGNTDAEGRMVMADVLCHVKEKALKETNPHLFTIATLTGHAKLAMGPEYSVIMDNGPAKCIKTAQRIQNAGDLYGDLFEISTIRREDYEFHTGKSEYEDVLQCNNKPSSQTPRGHQGPSAFLIKASGLDKHGIDSDHPLPYSHVDIAGSSGPFPGVPTGAPILAFASEFILNHI